MHKATSTFENPLAQLLEQQKVQEAQDEKVAAAAERAKVFGDIVAKKEVVEEAKVMKTVHKSRSELEHEEHKKKKVESLKLGSSRTVNHSMLLNARKKK